MATRKKKNPLSLSWLRSLRQRLTNRTACFVWGAIFGNAVLSQPINPLNLLLQPPEYMLSATSQAWLQSLRNGLRSMFSGFGGAAVDSLREQAGAHLPSVSQALLPSTSTATQGRAQSGEGFAACADQFPAQRPLHVAGISTDWAPMALCSDAFAVLYSGLTKTPMVVVEKLHRPRLQQAAGLERTDQFYADTRVPPAWRAELSDYQGSGYDRGHLSPAANQPHAQAMAQSFALSNMVPQDPTHNRKLWSKLESDVRKYVQRASGNVFVFTGALHEGQPRTTGRNQVWVPSHLFKLVYDEREQRAWAYVLPNRADASITRPMDYASFVQRTQWQLLGDLPVVGSIR